MATEGKTVKILDDKWGAISFALVVIAIIVGMMWKEWLDHGAPRFW